MSEYIPGLRQELVKAAARERAGTRRPVPVRGLADAAAAAILLIGLVLALRAVELPTDEHPALPGGEPGTLAYRVVSAPGADGASAAERSAAVLRDRLAAAGIADAKVEVSGDRITVDAPSASRATVRALAVPGTLAIYDWEASVLNSDGQLEPGNAQVTGGQDAGRGGAVTHYEAVLRAAKADGTDDPPVYWLVDDSTRDVLSGPQRSRDALGPVPEGARVVEAPGGVRVVRAAAAGPDRWYALAGLPAVGNADVETALAVRDPLTNEPVVAVELTAHGRAMFHALTREIARRGADAHVPGTTDPMAGVQHLAIVLDDEIAAVPFIDHQEVPDGIDGSAGVSIEGGLSDARAREIAILLESGALPAALAPAP